jgi:hypothetical protein
MKGVPFKRLQVLINFINNNKEKFTALQIQKVFDSYRSRGKGKSKIQAAPKHKHMTIVRVAKARRNALKRSHK